MPKITINGRECEFEQGKTILQVANDNGIEIPQYCYHDSMSIVASCRICLAEVHAPNPRNDNKLEEMPKLLPTCQAGATDGMVVYTESPKAVRNQKSVMEYLLINHPLDCPVCDQSGECSLQDYSYQYGRGVSRFEEAKVKQPKKSLGPNVYLYADRCIMCTRCVRFTREVSGTSELITQGRGNKTEIDIFPGVALDNELSANVIDLCPVGALLDKDFLFAQRVWFLKSTPSIDGITSSGDNILVEHNEGKVYRVKPRTNMDVNKWWITDEVRYGWKHIHSDERISAPARARFGVTSGTDWNLALTEATNGIREATEGGKRLALLVSPMLSCEDAYALAQTALTLDPNAVIGMGPVPVNAEDKVFPVGASEGDANAFVMRAEKAPNARGVKRVLDAVTGDKTLDFDGFVGALGDAGAAIITGNYPSTWATDDLAGALDKPFVVLIDTLASALTDSADVILPGATWLEKAGTFENVNGLIQAFEQAIPTQGLAKSEGQIALDLLGEAEDLPRASVPAGVGVAGTPGPRVVPVDVGPGQVPQAVSVLPPRSELFNAASMRQKMAEAYPALHMFTSAVRMPVVEVEQEASDMAVVEL